MLLYLRGLYLTRKKMKMPCGQMGRGPWGQLQEARSGEELPHVTAAEKQGSALAHSESKAIPLASNTEEMDPHRFRDLTGL